MSTPLRLMTANLLKDRTDAVMLGGLLDRVEPDLVMFQEMGAEAAEVLAARYDHRFLYPSTEHEGRGVASRFEAECRSLSLPWRPGVLARLTLDGKTLAVAGVHMSNPIDFPWWRSVGQRSDQMAALISWADEESADALVVAGDMNASPRWPLYRHLTARWEDLVLAASRRSGTKPDPTWGWRPGWPRMLRIDHVMGQGAQAMGVFLEPIRGSDHHAVVVDLVVD